MKVYFETLGCPKNFNDSQVAEGLLEKGGHEIVNIQIYVKMTIISKGVKSIQK